MMFAEEMDYNQECDPPAMSPSGRHSRSGAPSAFCAKTFKRPAGRRAFRKLLKLCGVIPPGGTKLIFLRASRRLARYAIIREESQTGLKCPICSNRGLRSERVCENSL